MSTKHSKAAERFMNNTEHERWHNETLWQVRAKRDKLAMEIPEWEQLRDISAQIKMHTITHLDQYLTQFTEQAEANGAIIHWAKDANDHNEIVYDILRKR